MSGGSLCFVSRRECRGLSTGLLARLGAWFSRGLYGRLKRDWTREAAKGRGMTEVGRYRDITGTGMLGDACEAGMSAPESSDVCPDDS